MENSADTAQNDFLQKKKEKKVRVIMLNGFQQPGTLEGYDQYVIILKDDAGKESMIYKSAISTIKGEE